MKKISRALLSVHDKSRIVELADFLAKNGVELFATAGTQKLIDKAGVPIREVSALVGDSKDLPPGKLRTINPIIHAAVSAESAGKIELEALKSVGGGPVNMVVIDLPPFDELPSSSAVKGKEPRGDESIGIGELFLLRSALQNYRNVAVVTNPAQYDKLKEKISETGGELSEKFIAELASDAFELLADHHVKHFNEINSRLHKDTFMADTIFLKYKKATPLRYGENPHQRASFFSQPGYNGVSLCDVRKIRGPEMSYNNFNDLNSALSIALEFERETVVIVKHGNPTAVVLEKDPVKAYTRAREADKVAAFGGTVVFNFQVDKKTARELTETFMEVIAAPKFTDGAIQFLLASKKTAQTKILEIRSEKWAKPTEGIDIRTVMGGVVIQELDNVLVSEDAQIKVVTKRKPTRKELSDLIMAWKVCKYVRSNAVVLGKDNQTVGVGAGQMSRLDSLKIAIDKAGDACVGAALASDAYFPFRNVVDEAARYGIAAIIQPGGAKRDDEIISACDEHNIALCVTGMRHFKH